ncbi:uncharacterized protein LOC126779643 isoform X2 [Nymphalis io]|uniref:uncharacterized protein LOC126779643 isoform X2 n=1 Tax=Inachis io TaxID=171585 RepID=UPI002169824E|nr:uncharacterized protein LOC126779643 isoform X2 [Nymphalis io]
MADGPRPMKNLKPAQNLNSAEQFHLVHQSEYENRSKGSVDRMKRVHDHNLAYPKLRDELDKRRSVMQVIFNEKEKSPYDSKCKACMKLKQLTKLRKLNIKPRCTPKTSKRKYYRESKSRVKKRSKNGKNRTKIYKQKKINNKLYNYVEDTDKNNRIDCGTDPIIKLHSNDRSHTIELQDNNKNGGKRRSEQNSSSNSVNTFNNPNTSNFSVSSYNTYPSMDHEPMVSPD